MTKTQKLLAENFSKINFEFDYSLKEKNYFKLAGKAEAFVEIDDKQELVELIKFCKKNKIKLTILGGASNVIIDDNGIQGLLIRLTNQIIKITNNIVMAQAGTKMSTLVQKTVAAGLTGLEAFLGVPGTLGGAIYNNAHYLSQLIGEHVNRVEVINQTGQSNWLNKDECDFAYDHSRFQTSKEIIWQVEFLLQKGDEKKSKQLIKEATEYRAETQPLGKPSSGCIFKNPPNTPKLKKLFPQFAQREQVPAGFLIDQAGLKGTRVGQLEVSHKHAAFIINNGNGKSEDLKNLINLIKATVKEKFGIILQEEVFYLT